MRGVTHNAHENEQELSGNTAYGCGSTAIRMGYETIQICFDVAERRGMVFLTAPVGWSHAGSNSAKYIANAFYDAIHLGCRGTAENLLQFVFEDFEFVGSL